MYRYTFPKSLIKEYALNHLGILIMVYGILLHERRLAALGPVMTQRLNGLKKDFIVHIRYWDFTRRWYRAPVRGLEVPS